MSSDSTDNPCCKKKGTLIITIEPCTKGRDTKPDRPYFIGERYIPGLPRKTPRTMEIEVKLKTKDQELFSDEELSHASPDEEIKEIDEEEVELETQSLDDGEEPEVQSEERKDSLVEEESKKRNSSEESMKSIFKPSISCSAKTIILESKPCSKTCPGPLICRQRKEHFFGDRCKLHDPTMIGKQILEMHKKGVIRKHLYENELIYPKHILSAVSEISRRQASGFGKMKESDSGDKGDVVEEVAVKRTLTPIEIPRVTKEVDQIVIGPKIERESRAVKEGGIKKKGSGCFC